MPVINPMQQSKRDAALDPHEQIIRSTERAIAGATSELVEHIYETENPQSRRLARVKRLRRLLAEEFTEMAHNAGMDPVHPHPKVDGKP